MLCLWEVLVFFVLSSDLQAEAALAFHFRLSSQTSNPGFEGAPGETVQMSRPGVFSPAATYRSHRSRRGVPSTFGHA